MFKANRRDFLKVSAALTAGLMLPKASQAAFLDPRPLAIMQGATSDTFVQLAVDLPVSLSVRYQLFEVGSKQVIAPKLVTKAERIFSKDRVDQVQFEKLRVGVKYIFQVIDDRGLVLDERELRTLDIKKQSARIALLSCMDDGETADIQSMWNNLKLSNPDLILFLGDNAYVDRHAKSSGSDYIWNRYRETRHNLPFYHWRELVPTLAIWDDHDFGKNNVLGDFKYRDESLQVFNDSFAQTEIPGFYDRAQGVSASVNIFNHRFVFLEGRLVRTKSQMLGSEQLDWVSEQVRESGDTAVLINGTQMSNRESSNSLQAISPQEYSDLSSILNSVQKPVLFASGDVHYTDVSQLSHNDYGFSGYEITSSCMHSNFLSKMQKNQNRIASALGNNFVILDVAGNGSYAARSIGAHSERFNINLNMA